MILKDHQRFAISKLRSGSILVGGVGSGKSITALTYFFTKVCNGKFGDGEYKKPTIVKDLYIITTAQKRDKREWNLEALNLSISENDDFNLGIRLVVDSWNNIKKYVTVKDSFFIFDEQRLVGSGVWVNSFFKIAKSNEWILLTATPGDSWKEYIPVFVANGFYKNRTEFTRRHIIFKPFMNFPVIDRYIETDRLEKLKALISVRMDCDRYTERHEEVIIVSYDKELYSKTIKERYNYFTETFIDNASGMCQALRKVVNFNYNRLAQLLKILKSHDKAIIFYNYNYELDFITPSLDKFGILYKQWNGHKHELIPDTDSWVYLVQYNAGAEGWNCIQTDTIIFFSLNYSYKIMTQAAGRIDRLNTPFKDLYYYYLETNSPIDKAIRNCLRKKKDFNEKEFADEVYDFHSL